MPKSYKKSASGKNRRASQHNMQSDFTVYDYANAEPSGNLTGRMKKSETNSLSSQIKGMAGSSAASEASSSLAWYEKDLSDFELDVDSDTNTEDHEEENPKSRVISSKSRTHTKAAASDDHVCYKEYHVDIWFMLAEYINPEDIGRFSGICRTTHYVAHTARFWINLYERFYKDYIKLPSTLQPSYIVRHQGLRARIIRSMFILYTPFIERVRSNVPFESEPYSLEGQRCLLMWYKKMKNHWYFHFKFKTLSTMQCPLSASTKCSKRDLVHGLCDIHDNSEEGCCVLQVVTLNFISLPCVMGQLLLKTFLNVGQAMRYHKVKLLFHPQQLTNRNKTYEDATCVVLDPVVNMRVLHWWDPKYPGNES